MHEFIVLAIIIRLGYIIYENRKHVVNACE